MCAGASVVYMCIYVYLRISVCAYIPLSGTVCVFVSVTNICRGVRVERDSVNSITIDNEPQDKHERIMIAAHVGLNPNGNTMVLRCVSSTLQNNNDCFFLHRDTTLMPNIHGLASLVCLLFAPTVEMRYRVNYYLCMIYLVC